MGRARPSSCPKATPYWRCLVTRVSTLRLINLEISKSLFQTGPYIGLLGAIVSFPAVIGTQRGDIRDRIRAALT
jgi:hypothetical protein